MENQDILREFALWLSGLNRDKSDPLIEHNANRWVEDFIAEKGKFISPEDFGKEMKKIKEPPENDIVDDEAIHIRMDYLMCKVLRSLGYGKGVDIFTNTPKWYS